MKQTIKLRESELKRMIAESVRRVLNEQQVASQQFTIFWSENDSFIYCGGEFFHMPQDQDLHFDVNTYDGRWEVIEAMENGTIPYFNPNKEVGMTDEEFYVWLKKHGYRMSHYNANAF